MILSIIVPCYNSEEHIKRCLNSLINQNLNANDYEIIVINDGSTDNSKKLVENIKANHKNIKLYHQENKGLGAVRNRGMEIAKGEYIYFIDSDDYLAHNTLGVVINCLKKFNLDLIGFKTIITKKLDLFISENTNTQDINITNGIDFMLKNKNHRYEAWWYVIKNEYLQQTQFKFEEGKFLEDVIFTFKILINAKKMAFLPIDAHRYVENSNSIMNNESQPHLTKLINNYVSLIHRLFHLKKELQDMDDSEQLKVLENIKYTSSLNTCFVFFKILRSNISIKKINRILNDLKSIGAYPFERKFLNEGYDNYKIKISSYIFNKRVLFYLLLYPIRFLYKKRIIRLP